MIFYSLLGIAVLIALAFLSTYFESLRERKWQTKLLKFKKSLRSAGIPAGKIA